MTMGNREKTLLCVWIAGILFLLSVLGDVRYLAILAAFFDWLPLPTGWMRFGRARRDLVIAHAAVTLIAYAFLVVWLLRPVFWAKTSFITVWWSAVMVGVLMST